MEVTELTRAVDALRARVSDGRRVMLGITGAPGSGKSTVAAKVRELLGPAAAVVVPMDGFHLGNAIIDGTPLRHRKGAPDTFDAGGYVALLARLAHRNEDVVYAPEFRRELDEPVAASIAVPAEVPVVITEGNYLLADLPVWRQVRPMLTETWFVEITEDLRMERLVARHMAFGMDRAAATAWAAGPDQANADLISTTRAAAGLVIPWN